MDPVFKDYKDGKWYMWNEVWADSYGPFDTEDEARSYLERYLLYLEGKLPGQQVILGVS